MNILEVNDRDLPGRNFNGYELMNSLNQRGYNCKQLVLEKRSNNDAVISIRPRKREYVHDVLYHLEEVLSVQNILYPYSTELTDMDVFRKADIVHYHLLHNRMISLYDLPILFKKKAFVWTIHDPWILTGHCVYPLDCEGWLNGCIKCPDLPRFIQLKRDTASSMWKLKKYIFSQINPPIIVASNWMREHIVASPLTQHWNDIRLIPFGIDIKNIKLSEKGVIKKKLGLSEASTVIAFRNSGGVKGSKYIFEALLKCNKNIAIVTVDDGKLPEEIRKKFYSVEFGWTDSQEKMHQFYSVADIFLMPSEAESFGLMAIEAMAYGLPIICFENTVVQEISGAQDCGIAVKYRDSESLRNAIEYLISNRNEYCIRSEKSRERVKNYYSYDTYVKKHIELYREIIQKQEVEYQ